MFESPQIAFIDEYGDSSLHTEKSGVSTHFIVTAVIVKRDDLSNVRQTVAIIRDEHYPRGELKSSKVSKNDHKRLNILQALAKVPAHYYSIVIDKRDIDKNSGLIYKKPFLKFLNGLLHSRLFRVYPNLLVVADQHGHPEFMDGFKKYVESRHVPDFFLNAEFSFVASHNEVMIQVADIVAGTLARVYDAKKLSGNARQFLSAMEAQTLGIDEWPPKYNNQTCNINVDEDTQIDRTIQQMAVTHAILFIRENMDSKDETAQYQVETLKYLIYAAKFLNPSHYVSTKRLLEVMEQFCGSQMTGHFFRSNVIAPLRDRSLLIASSSTGYKLPKGRSDLMRTVDQFDNIIGPMLSRLTKARNEVRLGTKGLFDLLGDAKHEKLREIIEVGEHASTNAALTTKRKLTK